MIRKKKKYSSNFDDCKPRFNLSRSTSPLWLMPGRHRSSRSRPIADRPASIAADSAVVDADSSRTERRERRGRQLRRHVANCRCWQLSNGGLSLSLLSRRFRRWRGASEERWSKKRKDEPWEEGGRGQFGDGGRRWAAGRGGRKAAGNLWFKESDPSCDMPAFNRRHLFVKSVPKDSSLVGPCSASASSVKIGQMFRGKAWKRLWNGY